MLDWVRLFCEVDDFCCVFEPQWEQQQIEAGIKHRSRPSALEGIGEQGPDVHRGMIRHKLLQKTERALLLGGIIRVLRRFGRTLRFREAELLQLLAPPRPLTVSGIRRVAHKRHWDRHQRCDRTKNRISCLRTVPVPCLSLK
jgi:hypothetical protein